MLVLGNVISLLWFTIVASLDYLHETVSIAWKLLVFFVVIQSSENGSLNGNQIIPQGFTGIQTKKENKSEAM